MKSVSKIVCFSMLFLMSCGGGDSKDDQPKPIAAPKATTLVFPDNNKECTAGVVVDATKSTVTFQWNASENTDSYEVNIRNLSTNSILKVNAKTNESPITIDRGAPYEWFVISKATGNTETASSAIFKFYNQGAGITNYAPFPADAVQPARGAVIGSTTSVRLEWVASDIDDDIIGFDVLFDTEASPSTLMGMTAETTMSVSTTSGQTYYWKVITTDSQENTSESAVFQFKVN